MKKILSLLLALLVALSCTAVAFAEDEEVSDELKALGEKILNNQKMAMEWAIEGFTCQSEKVEAELLPDGTVNITEYWTFSCKNYQKMTQFDRTIKKSDDYEISNISVKMGSKELERKYDIKDVNSENCEYMMDETDDGYDLSVYYQNWNTTITVKVLYTVKGAVQFHNDIMEFNWEMIGNDIPYDAKLFTGYVILPYGAERKEVKAWTHDQENAEVIIESGELVSMRIEEVPEHHPIALRVTAPLYLFPTAAAEYKTGRDAYREILTEENDPDKDPANAAREAKKDRVIQTAVPAVLLVGAALIIFFSHRKKKHA